MPTSIYTLSCEDAIEFVLEAGWGYAEVDAQGKFVWINPAFAKILNGFNEVIINRRFEDWVDPEDRPICNSMLDQILQGLIPSFMLRIQFIQRGSAPRNRRVIWGMLSVRGKWKGTEEFLGYRVTFQPYNNELSSQEPWLDWSKVFAWSIANWKLLATILGVSISLMLGGSEKLFEIVKEVQKVKESVDGLSPP